jgi:hypothetical protein
MFNFIDKLKEKFFKGKNQQEKRDRNDADIKDGKSKPVKREKWAKRVKKIHRGGMSGGNKTQNKLYRKMSRARNYGGVAYRVTANSSPESRKAARRALA